MSRATAAKRPAPRPAKFRVLGVEDLTDIRRLYARFGDCATLFNEELVARGFTALERREMLASFVTAYFMPGQ